ncbi:TetR/AcrR family transcriptional regulator [Cupriavidus sp. UGS-1]|uniref:TetR/AcrR family transcriptional regulator n=1 Tax=Cupriavidus sp. UGS-1 TaxID=2899826 RepID=UPI001E2DFBAB|nr:TetR/AcrR family transcriptional regulator [Cupriavidus sp. UGS-1]MCD9123436.1 TetR/AcrR family transcriptional regulator [Cupriavidus sp. UGS-1]
MRVPQSRLLIPMELSPRAAEIAEHTKLLLAAGGYHGFSYADLSERVRIGKPSIHHHFPSKADLVLTVVALHRAQTRQGLAALDGQIGDPLARLTAYIDYWSRCIRDGTSSMCICAMLAAELPIIPQEIANEVRAYFEDLTAWLATVLEAGAAKGQLQLRDTALVEAQTFMSTVHGAMLTARAFDNPEAFASISQAAIRRLTGSN